MSAPKKARTTTLTKTGPTYHAFEPPLMVEVAVCNTEFFKYSGAFLEIRGVTITVKEITPDMVKRALGTDPSTTFRFHDHFPSSIAKDLYKQAEGLLSVVNAGEDEDEDEDESSGGEREEEEREREREREANVVFDMAVAKRPHHVMLVIEQDGFEY